MDLTEQAYPLISAEKKVSNYMGGPHYYVTGAYILLPIDFHCIDKNGTMIQFPAHEFFSFHIELQFFTAHKKC